MRTFYILILLGLFLTSCASLENSSISSGITKNQKWRDLDQGRFEAGSRFK